MNNQIFKNIFLVLLSFAIFLGVTRASMIITDIFLKGSFKYTWYIGNHIIQSIIVLVIIGIFRVFNKDIDFGLKKDESKQTKSYLIRFMLVFMILTILIYAIIIIIYGWQDYIGFPLTKSNVIQYLVFEGVVVGIGEELLFRALIYSILYQGFAKKIHIGKKVSLSYAVILSALIFSIAHINLFDFSFDIFQLFMAFVLGVFYGWLLENTKSIIGPILAHNLSDLWMSLLFILCALMV